MFHDAVQDAHDIYYRHDFKFRPDYNYAWDDRIYGLFRDSIVKYNPNKGNCYLEDGLIVMGNERVEPGFCGRVLGGPFHALGHFLESPDKYINRPFFGFMLGWEDQKWMPRELDAVINHLLLYDWSGGEELSERAKENWFAMFVPSGVSKNEYERIMRYAFAEGGRTIEWCLAEWERKNELLRQGKFL